MIEAITQEDLQQRIDGLDVTVARGVVCALVGHSRYQTFCFGYYHCFRCNQPVGDSLASTYDGAPETVVIGHDCDTCRENAAKCTWRDTFLLPELPENTARPA